jgi:hypothetical protein
MNNSFNAYSRPLSSRTEEIINTLVNEIDPFKIVNYIDSISNLEEENYQVLFKFNYSKIKYNNIL